MKHAQNSKMGLIEPLEYETLKTRRFELLKPVYLAAMYDAPGCKRIELHRVEDSAELMEWWRLGLPHIIEPAKFLPGKMWFIPGAGLGYATLWRQIESIVRFYPDHVREVA